MYDSVNNTVRLPKYGKYIWTQGADVSAQQIPVKTNLWSFGNNAGALAIPARDSANAYYVGSQDGSGNVFVNDSIRGDMRWYADLDAIELTPQIDGYYYIIVANSIKTDIQVDIDEIATDLNNKVDKSDLQEVQCVVETYVNDTSGYWIRSDGYCEQWGRGNTSNSTVTISLLKPYRDVKYSVTAGNNTSGSYSSPCACSILSTSQIQLRCGGTVEWMWQTRGYLF